MQRRRPVDAFAGSALKSDGVVVPLTVATCLVLAFALFLELLVASHFAGDVLDASLDPLAGGRCFFTNTLVVAGFGRVVRVVAVVELIHGLSSSWRAVRSARTHN